ncbi:pentapeptide repeat-containing protein [Streptomyces sp. NPDC029216]|uniref:pentapeptide repeat-containing protein n=1 Tax=Streptomyces sp. NPDC029216 TaxID=3154701 RepID=UPI0033C65354
MHMTAAPYRPAPDLPSWPHCDGSLPGGAECRGRQVEHHTACLAHLPDAERLAYLAGLRPGADVDHRGTHFTEELVSALLAALTDPSTRKPRIGQARFEEAVFGGGVCFDLVEIDGDVVFDGAEISGDVSFDRAEVGSRVLFRQVKIGGDARFDRMRVELTAEQRREVITLPPTIGELTSVKLVRIPPEIGAMKSLEEFTATGAFRVGTSARSGSRSVRRGPTSCPCWSTPVRRPVSMRCPYRPKATSRGHTPAGQA